MPREGLRIGRCRPGTMDSRVAGPVATPPSPQHLPGNVAMRAILLACSIALCLAAPARAQVVDSAVPLGKLSDAAKPMAYRVDMTIVPD